MAVTLDLPISQVGPGAPGEGFGTTSVGNVDRDDFVHLDDAEQDTIESKKPVKEMLPPELELSDEEEMRLSQYLSSELYDAQAERWQYIEAFARWRWKYRTKFPEFPKDWPIANSSQITMPVIKMACQTLTSRIYQVIMSADPPISIRTKNPDFQDFSVAYEEFLGLYCEERLQFEDRLDTIVTECIKMGTAVAEVTTMTDRRSVITYDPLTKQYKRAVKDIYNGPCLYHVPIDDFWIRVAYQDVQTAPWCGKSIRLTWSQIKDMAAAGELNPDRIDKVWRLPESPGEKNEALIAQEKVEQREPMDSTEYRLFELCVRWDADGDGLDEEMIVYYHWETRTLLRRKYNTFRNGRRPWVVFRYIRTEHRFFGEGMCEMLEHLQEEISTIHNQRIDNATISSLQILLTKKLIRGLAPGDRLWSGKIVKADPADVGTLRMGEIYPSTVQNEQISQNYARELSGANEAISGSAQPVTRTTATAQMALLEEANRRFDKIVRGFRKSVKEIGVHASDLLADYGTYGLAEEWLGDDRGQLVETMLADPRTFSPGACRVTVLATRSTVNKEVEFQSAIAVMNLVVQTGQQMLQLTAQMAPQYAPLIGHQLVVAIKGPWKKVMQYSDSGNVEEAMGVIRVLERILPAPEDMGGMDAALQAEAAAGGGASPGAGGANQPGNGQGPAGAEGATSLSALMQAMGRPDGGVTTVGQRGRNGR